MATAIVVSGIAAAVALGGAGTASATSASASWKLAGGDTFQVNGWHCASYFKTCSWTASTKLLGNNPSVGTWIENRTELQAHGVNASLTISKNPSATLKMKSKSLGEVRWRNTRSWIADSSGTMKPGWTTVYVSVRSCGSSVVTSRIKVTEKCVYAGAA